MMTDEQFAILIHAIEAHRLEVRAQTYAQMYLAGKAEFREVMFHWDKGDEEALLVARSLYDDDEEEEGG